MSKRKAKQRKEKTKLNRYYYENVCNCKGIEQSVSPVWEQVEGKYIAKNIETIKYSGNIFDSEIAEWIFIHLPNIKNIYMVDVVSVSNKIGVIKSIRSLCITGDKFSCIPEGISELLDLENLDFSRTSIECIPDSLCKLVDLKYLSLHNTRISRIPEYIGELKKLKHLNLSNLSLDLIPNSLMNLNLPFIFDNNDWRLASGINLYQTTLKEQDVSVFTKNREFIAEYLSDSDCNLKEGKVIFLGDGFVGKTFIIERIRHDNELLPENFTTCITEGIRIVESGTDFKIHFWDFGGEQIAHSMHRCFLTQRTVYVVVLSAREENFYSILDYWMRTINSFARNSSVVVVVNKIDEFPYSEVSEKIITKKYTNVLKVFTMSALKDSKETFSNFSNYIINTTKLLIKEYGITFPKRWIPIKKSLESTKLNYITGDFFNSLCDSYDKYLDKQKRTELLNWFNDLGIVFSYSSDRISGTNFILSNYHILKPIWLINAVYAIIFNAKQSKNFKKGIISFKDIYNIVIVQKCGLYKNTIYNASELPYILEVMRKFKISHRISDEIEFIPSVCTSKEPNECMEFETEYPDSLKYEIEYEHLPNDIVHRFIIKNYDYIEDKATIWLCGAKFRYTHLACEMILRKDVSDNKVIVLIRKESNLGEVRALLRIVKNDLKIINDELSVYPRNEFIRFVNQDKKTFKVDCGYLFKCLNKNIFFVTLEDESQTDVYQVNFKEVLSLMFDSNQVDEILTGKKSIEPLLLCNVYNSNIQVNGNNGSMKNG